MRIGILTFSCADNAGAVLQCYALKTFLLNSGYDVEVINYCPDYLTDSYGTFHDYVDFARRKGLYRSLTRMRADLMNLSTNVKRTKGFNSFRKDFLNISGKKLKTIRDFENEKYDAYIVGSDQIWSNMPGRSVPDPVFLLKFIKEPRVKKIAYAPSIGNVDTVDVGLIAKDISDFHAISVREEDVKNRLSAYSNKAILRVLDPVFLLSKEHYSRVFNEAQDFQFKNYIFVYSLQINDALLEVVNNVIGKSGTECTVIYYSRTEIRGFNTTKIYRIETLSPTEFLDLIMFADTCVTNSFHATAFSIIFHKNLYVIPHLQTGGRMTSLMELLGLKSRICLDGETISFAPIDWEKTEETIKDEVSRSEEFLLDALKF